MGAKNIITCQIIGMDIYAVNSQNTKGIHPGFILERELKVRHLHKGPFAISLQEYPQTISAITKGKRKMNTSLALKIEIFSS